LIFSGVYDEFPALKIITHHMGGMIPYFAGKIELGFDQIFYGTSKTNPQVEKAGLKKPILEYYKMLYGDTALNGMAPHLIARSGIAHVREGRHVFEDLSVEENLIAATWALKGRVGAAKPDFDRLFEYFPRLAERRQQRAGYLSGGEQQMLAISRALLSDPKLLIMDEPTEGLAPVIVEHVEKLLYTLSQEGQMSILLIEQNIGVATEIADEVAIMVNGRICGVFIDMDASPNAATTIMMTTMGSTLRTEG
jgi:ABC-type branched-subunit amino acid transport system ATPase component